MASFQRKEYAHLAIALTTQLIHSKLATWLLGFSLCVCVYLARSNDLAHVVQLCMHFVVTPVHSSTCSLLTKFFLLLLSANSGIR